MKNKLSFEQIKQACIEEYAKYLGGRGIDDFLTSQAEFEDATNIPELIYIIDGLGFNKVEAYDFLISSIIK